MTGLYVLIALGVVVLFGLFYGVGIYNRLVALKNRFENAFSQIEVQLKRRYDLIPNLVETAKGYMQHERGTLEAVIQARNQAVSGLNRRPPTRATPQPCRLWAVPKNAHRRARQIVRPGRSVSRLEGQPEHGPTERRDHVDREQGGLRPPGVQRLGDRLQHLSAMFPPVVFANMLGHSHDAELLDFDDAQIAEAPKVSFG